MKVEYLTVENENRKNRNAILLNILLYIISLLGAIGALETLEIHFQVPFQTSFTVTILLFGLLGLLWCFGEYKNNKK